MCVPLLCTLQIKYNSEGDVVTDEKRDYLGNLTSIKLTDKMTGITEVITEASRLKAMEIIEEEVRVCVCVCVSGSGRVCAWPTVWLRCGLCV